MDILLFIGILVALIVVHELGHFAAAKLFGVKVEEFGIFFPPRLISRRWGETRYSLNLLPLGGFVKIFGENYDEGKGSPRSFVGKSRPVQALVLAAGIGMNFLFAWFLLSVGYMGGLPTPVEHIGFGEVVSAEPTITAVVPGSPAAVAGLMAGDTIVEVSSGKAFIQKSNADAVEGFFASHRSDELVLSVERAGELVTASMKAAEGVVEGQKAVGIQFTDIGMLTLPPHLAFLQGSILFKEMTVATAVGLASFFADLAHGQANFSMVAGPIGIVGLGAGAVESGFASALILTALISINLALINLIPIPGLDGGRLLIVGVEGLTRRAVPVRVITSLTLAGFALLILLMVLVTYHDIARLVG